jgi:hypothetical protein
MDPAPVSNQTETSKKRPAEAQDSSAPVPNQTETDPVSNQTETGKKKKKRLAAAQDSSDPDANKWDAKDAHVTALIRQIRKTLPKSEESQEVLASLAKLTNDYKRKVKELNNTIVKTNEECKALKDKLTEKPPSELDDDARVLLAKYSPEDSTMRIKLTKIAKSLQWDWDRRLSTRKRSKQEIERFKSHKKIWSDMDYVLDYAQRSAVRNFKEEKKKKALVLVPNNAAMHPSPQCGEISE